ncbi:MAG TPA: 50S ribosomal protein L11 methyltransferase [Candidatus Binataceae bacterium]|nr:50S ribosomal protein L11 methyltransferase [Candidatus Binataceae bacterium]
MLGRMTVTRSATSAARKYVQVAFATPAAMVDDAAAFLVAQGALGCAVGGDHRSAHRHPTLELHAYFDHLSRPRLAAIRRTMAAAGMLADSGRTPPPRIVADPGWATAWKDRFEPLPIGRRLLVVPPWNAEVAVDRTRIVINPGQAFGTGHHGSTCGALATIEKLCAARRFERGLDAGTGSGVLAIAMRMMGVGDVRAIDIDPVALENARENAALNGLGGRGGIRFATTPVARLRRRFDLIAANILSSTLIAMAAPLTRLLAPTGRLILGGILSREAAAVLRAYRPPLRCLGVRRDRGWSTLVLAR